MKGAGMTLPNPWQSLPTGILIQRPAFRVMIQPAITAAVFRLFRAGSEAAVVISATLATSGSGGPLWRTQQVVPFTGT